MAEKCWRGTGLAVPTHPEGRNALPGGRTPDAIGPTEEESLAGHLRVSGVLGEDAYRQEPVTARPTSPGVDDVVHRRSIAAPPPEAHRRSRARQVTQLHHDQWVCVYVTAWILY